eukprot:CAMPEP_0182544252 /NCGR_PEP_ID=MMETSP1323-20130603/32844_1 /TAXON_ID=236787 /ORGANISM="Florenciella parvula, Strain RCC1693" /LENGTH=35 /DNA_ID= /DNA_START= /DNA_END= /DNA_ORIENTATION=
MTLPSSMGRAAQLARLMDLRVLPGCFAWCCRGFHT